MQGLRLERTNIPGLLVLRLPVQPNEDGWFKANWHRDAMVALGLPDFNPVQHNVTHVATKGITRGLHAEPWDRLVSLVRGRAVGAWVDLRAGNGFGRTMTLDLSPAVAVFVPRGVANGHQVTEDDTTFSYLMGQHWTPEARALYLSVDAFDPVLAIDWPIPRERAIVARRDTLNPPLADVTPAQQRRTLVVGADTPLGDSLARAMTGAQGIGAAEITTADSLVDLAPFDTLIHAQGPLLGPSPETMQPAQNWSTFAATAQALSSLATRHRLRYVQVSTDCPFEHPSSHHDETAQLDLSNSWGQCLAASELVAGLVPRHLIIRTSWVTDPNSGLLDEVATNLRKGRTLQVDDQQWGRMTAIKDLASGIQHLLDSSVYSGVFNLTGDGPPSTRRGIAMQVASFLTSSPALVRDFPPSRTRPNSPVLSLSKIKTAGAHLGPSAPSADDFVDRFDSAGWIGHGASGAIDPSLKVLFVCTANICRSAFADVIAQAQAPAGVTFSSAGTHALVGKPMDPPLAGIVSDRGMDPTHVARQLTRELAEDADLILTMSAEHRRFILDAWPALARRVFVIGQAERLLQGLPPGFDTQSMLDHLWRHRAPHEGDEVADPFGRGTEAARSAAGRIDTAVTVITEALAGLDAPTHPASPL